MPGISATTRQLHERLWLDLGGKTNYRVGDTGNCTIYFEHRPAATGSNVAEILLLNVSTPQLPQDVVCNLAATLAAAAEEQLPG